MKTPKQLTNAAEGRRCTLNIAGVCNYEADTTVACHLSDGTGGSNKYTGPLSFVFGCSSCHAEIDGRQKQITTELDREFYMRRGLMRTLRILHDNGLLKIRGIDY